MKMRSAVLGCVLVSCLISVDQGVAQNTYDWNPNSHNASWDWGGSGNQLHWIRDNGDWLSRPDTAGAGIVRFNNNNNAGTMQVNSSSDYAMHQLIFQSGATTARTLDQTESAKFQFYDFGGANAKLENQSTASHVIDVPVVLNTTTEINPVSGNLEIDGTINNNGNAILIYGNNSKQLTLDGVISGGGSLTVKQNSTVLLNAANTYSGATGVEAGTLRLGAAGRISDSSALSVSGGTFDLNNFNETVASLSLSGGTVSMGTGQLIVNDAAGTWSGSLSASSGGSIVLKGSGAVGLTAANSGLAAGSAIYLDNGTLGLNNASAAGSATIYMGAGSGSDAVKVDSTQSGITIANAIEVRSTGGTKTIDNAGGGTLTFSGGITLNDDLFATSSGSENLVFSGTVGGANHIVKQGDGTMTLSGNNTFSQGVFVDNGTLRVSHASGAGTGTITLGAESGSDTPKLEVTVASINNAITVRSTGGDKTIDNATGGTMTLGGALSVAGRVFLTTGSGETTVLGGGVSGAGDILKQGDGTLRVSSTANIGGELYFDQGTLQVASGGSLTGDGVVDLGSAVYNPGGGAGTANATIELQSGNSGISADITVKGGSGTRAITSAGGTISGDVALENSLDLTSSSGTLTLSGAVNLSNSGNNDLRVGGAGNTAISGAISAATGASSIDKSGSGTLTLSGNNTGSSFMLNVAQGTVALNNANALGSGYGDKVNFTGTGTLDVNANVGPSSLGVRVANGQTATLDVNSGNTFTVATLANISGSGTIDKTGAGTLALTGNSGSFNGLTLSAGTLSIGAGAAIGTITQSGGTLSVAATAQIGATTANSGSLTVSGTAGNLTVGGASVTVSGTAGTIDLNSGAVVVGGSSGAVDLGGGTLSGSGTIASLNQTSGTLNPGNSPGTLNVTGNANWTGGTYLWEINALAGNGGAVGTDPGWDYVDITGTLTIGVGYTVTIDDLAVLTGWNNTQNYSWLIATADGGISGFNNLGLLGGFNLNSVSGSFGLRQDGNDIYVDYTYVDGGGGGGGGPSAVPEPSTISFAMLSGMVLYSLRRYVRKSRHGEEPVV